MTLRGGVLRMTTPDLNTIPKNCVRENPLWLSGYGIGLSTGRPWFEARQDHISAMHLFISFFVTDFVCKTSLKTHSSAVHFKSVSKPFYGDIFTFSGKLLLKCGMQ